MTGSSAPSTPRAIVRRAQELAGAGETSAALTVLRDALARDALPAGDLERAGRLIQRTLRAMREEPPPLRVRLLGQCTTSWLVPGVAAVAWGHDVALLANEGGYDTVLQDACALSQEEPVPDVVVLVPWHQRLLGDGPRSAVARVEDEVQFWSRVWGAVVDQSTARILQVGYDWVGPGPLGGHVGGGAAGHVGLVRETNAALRAALPSGAYFLDLEQVSGTEGRRAVYDPRNYHWAKQPFSTIGTMHVARHLFAGIRALTFGPKKVLVVDLDNTLWGGVVGEAGPLGITLGDDAAGEAYRAFQRYLKGLAERGCLLAVASKNNPADAREPFAANPDMILSLEDFAGFEAGWSPKSVMLERLATTLRLGLDSFVFFDDSPFEREQVRTSVPDVAVVNVPDDPAEYVRVLEAGLWFETVEVTDADRARAKQYTQERQRQSRAAECTSIDDYLRSLELRGEVRPVDDVDMARVVQLIGKTNQFNLTTRRHSEAAVRGLIAQPGAVTMTLRLRDRFGDYGLIAVLLAVPAEESPALRIDTWLMSCRAIGRTAEQFLFRALVERAEANHCPQLIGEFLPTAKNAIVGDLYERLAFTRLPDEAGGCVRYTLDLPLGQRPQTHVEGQPRGV